MNKHFITSRLICGNRYGGPEGGWHPPKGSRFVRDTIPSCSYRLHVYDLHHRTSPCVKELNSLALICNRRITSSILAPIISISTWFIATLQASFRGVLSGHTLRMTYRWWLECRTLMCQNMTAVTIAYWYMDRRTPRTCEQLRILLRIRPLQSALRGCAYQAL